MRQVLPVVGAIVGAYIGSFTGNTAQGAQLGWAIGSMVGNAVDPQVIKGPSIGDIAQQTSQEGVPRPIVFGLSQPISGNIVACSQPKIVTKKNRSGKGGGPITTSESVYRTYAIGVCEGEMPPAWLVRCWSNGKLVYDARPGHAISSNSKFMGDTRLFNGSFHQMPSPDLEAIFGSGNVPAMRGTAYIVRVNIDLTSANGAVEQLVFQVLRCGGEILTSKPYSILIGPDAVQRSGELLSGGILDQIIKEIVLEEPDAVQRSGILLGGILQEPIVNYTGEPDAVQRSGILLGGILQEPIVNYTGEPDAVQRSGILLTGGILDQIVIPYTPEPDSVRRTGQLIGGTLV